MHDFWILLSVASLAFLYEICDSSLGQGYGTLGTPTFILLGFSSKMVVPAILVSQAIGGLAGAFFHNKFRNVDFSNHKTGDIKKVYVIVLSGVIGVMIASFVGFKVSKDVMTLYIGLIVLIMGILILSGRILRFSWKKFCFIGAVSAFNKGLSGGGYGPVVAGGQVIIGIGGKHAVGITDFAEAPICISGFLVWYFLQGLPPFDFMLAMCIGAALAPALGAWITYRIPTQKLKKIMGIVILILGVLCLFKILSP